MCSSRSDCDDPVHAAYVECTSCDEIVLCVGQISVQCHDSQGYHKSRCVNCLLMEVDDCCFEITEEVLYVMRDYNESRLNNMWTQAQEATDRAAVNFLEWALCTVVLIEGPSDNARQDTDIYAQPPPSSSSVNFSVGSQHSPETDVLGDAIDAWAPEGLPDHADNMFPTSDGSTTQSEALNETEMSAYPEQTHSGGLYTVK